MRFTHRWQWGALGSLVLLALWFRPELPPAYGQGVGIFSRATCTQINAPVANETVCYNQSTATWQKWDGGAWRESGSGASYTLPNGSTYWINNLFAPIASGTAPQYGLAASITGSNDGTAATPRIALGVQAQTGGTGGNTIRGLNIVVQQNTADTVADVAGIELNVNNNKQDDTNLLSSSLHNGYSANSDGNKIAGFAYGVSGPAQWWRGYVLATSSIATGGFAFEYPGNGFGAVKVSASGSILNGNVADMGAGTINTASATFMNNLASQVASPTGINLQNIRGISASSNIPNNLRGTCTFAGAATCAVTFANNERDANYFVLVGGVVNISAKATTGFTMTATGTNSNAVDWMLIR